MRRGGEYPSSCISSICEGGVGGDGGGVLTKKITTTEKMSMETSSMGTSYSDAQECGMARRLPWRVVDWLDSGAR